MEKNKGSKIIAIVALVVAVFGLTLGFAAFSNTLTISSSAYVSPSSDNFKINFSTSSTSATATGNVTGSPTGAATAATATTATGITGADIDFEQVSHDVSVVPTGRYWSKAILAKDSKDKLFVNAKMETLTTQQVENIIAGVQHAKIWLQGGYYYQTIEHFGTTGKTTEFGMVKNHLYDFTITAISGLGTPVLDETKIITPEKPADEASYVAARINILSWRVVSDDNVTLN